ncbi:hypothetical protein HPB47_002802 [Ixodes persulcatus]|uniref:Uncharacterized protein n=1 Tax=Ixodes persulcatus TaxID=34615 RepID=A0AC60QZB7_IXOPE|nr:hypothetical protein HPB47_002802 [Ixodes persulcatus]
MHHPEWCAYCGHSFTNHNELIVYISEDGCALGKSYKGFGNLPIHEEQALDNVCLIWGNCRLHGLEHLKGHIATTHIQLPHQSHLWSTSHSERMTAVSLRGSNAVTLVVVCTAWDPAFVAAIFARAPRQPAAAAPIVHDQLRPANWGIAQPMDLLARPDGDLDAGLMDVGGDGAQPLRPERSASSSGLRRQARDLLAPQQQQLAAQLQLVAAQQGIRAALEEILWLQGGATEALARLTTVPSPYAQRGAPPLAVFEQLLKKFVARVPRLYRETAMTFNMHQTLHLANSVRHMGPLVLRDTGSNKVIIKRDLVDVDQITGIRRPVYLVDETVKMLHEARVRVSTPYFRGVVTALCMEEPLYDLILGNITGVRDPDSPGVDAEEEDDPPDPDVEAGGVKPNAQGEKDLTPDEVPRPTRRKKQKHDTAGTVETRNRKKQKNPEHQGLKTPRIEGAPVNTPEFRQQQKNDLAPCHLKIRKKYELREPNTTTTPNVVSSVVAIEDAEDEEELPVMPLRQTENAENVHISAERLAARFPPRRERATVTTWTVLVEDRPVGWASALRWREQPRRLSPSPSGATLWRTGTRTSPRPYTTRRSAASCAPSAECRNSTAPPTWRAPCTRPASLRTGLAEPRHLLLRLRQPPTRWKSQRPSGCSAKSALDLLRDPAHEEAILDLDL